MSKFENGTEVFWESTDGVAHGVYVVMECILEDGENSIYYIVNDFSDAETFEFELKEI